jgi:hypothetical protein
MLNHACENRPVRPRTPIVAVVLAAVLLAVAGCGGSTTYDVDKTRACLVKQRGVVISNKVDFVASNALGGSFSARLDQNEVTLSFAEDRPEAQRIVRQYTLHHGKNIGLEDVLRVTQNVVALWAAHPSDASLQTIRECLK